VRLPLGLLWLNLAMVEFGSPLPVVVVTVVVAIRSSQAGCYLQKPIRL
jgi:hypothetical protein